MGEVYLAHDTKLDRKVALKILPADVGGGDRVRRFVQEAKAASALNHPNILTIYEIDEIDSEQFIATEFIEGETLRDRIRIAAIKPREAIDIGIQVASALSATHSVGIVHGKGDLDAAGRTVGRGLHGVLRPEAEHDAFAQGEHGEGGRGLDRLAPEQVGVERGARGGAVDVEKDEGEGRHEKHSDWGRSVVPPVAVSFCQQCCSELTANAFQRLPVAQRVRLQQVIDSPRFGRRATHRDSRSVRVTVGRSNLPSTTAHPAEGPAALTQLGRGQRFRATSTGTSSCADLTGFSPRSLGTRAHRAPRSVC